MESKKDGSCAIQKPSLSDLISFFSFVLDLGTTSDLRSLPIFSFFSFQITLFLLFYLTANAEVESAASSTCRSVYGNPCASATALYTIFPFTTFIPFAKTGLSKAAWR